MTSDTALVILIVVGLVALLLYGISRFITKGMSNSGGSDFVGDAITGQFSSQDRKKAMEMIRFEKEDKRETGAQGEKYDDLLPPVDESEETSDE